MKLFRTETGIYVQSQDDTRLVEGPDWDALVSEPGLYTHLLDLLPTCPAASLPTGRSILAPIGSQELWASGVTYYRSRSARMEEAESAGGADFYDKVYSANRPELFFKSNGWRVAGPDQPVRIRRDSTWDVPEPELTLLLASDGTINGYTIGNDMSSRSIEGENPLYLPQAKTYTGAAALGPCVLVHDSPLPTDTTIRLEIRRMGQTVFEASTQLSQLKRELTELAEFLFRETDFPQGAYLMTGTGIVPDSDFTLQSGDIVSIEIDSIGTLSNPVE